MTFHVGDALEWSTRTVMWVVGKDRSGRLVCEYENSDRVSYSTYFLASQAINGSLHQLPPVSTASVWEES